jgi:hypothetical protein
MIGSSANSVSLIAHNAPFGLCACDSASDIRLFFASGLSYHEAKRLARAIWLHGALALSVIEEPQDVAFFYAPNIREDIAKLNLWISPDDHSPSLK